MKDQNRNKRHFVSSRKSSVSDQFSSSKNTHTNLSTEKNGFVTATKSETTNEFFVASTKNFAAATKRFVDRSKHFVVVTIFFCYPYLWKHCRFKLWTSVYLFRYFFSFASRKQFEKKI